MLCNIIFTDVWVTIFYWTHVNLLGVDQMYRFFCWALTSFSKIAFQIWFIMTLNLIFDSDFLLLSRQVQTLSFILFRKKPIWHSQPRYAERNVCTSEKVILFHQNVFRKVVFSYQNCSWEKIMVFHDFANFQFPKTS